MPHQIKATHAGTNPTIVPAESPSQKRKTIARIDMITTKRCMNLDEWMTISSAIKRVSTYPTALNQHSSDKPIRETDDAVASRFLGLI